MKHFYAHLSASSKSDRTVSATKKESIQAHIRTYENGIFVSMYHENNKDIFLIYKTGGTLGDRTGSKMKLIKQIEIDNIEKWGFIAWPILTQKLFSINRPNPLNTRTYNPHKDLTSQKNNVTIINKLKSKN